MSLNRRPDPNEKTVDRLLGIKSRDRKAHVMGILNVTPDSFYDGGRYDSLESAFRQALQLEKDGADILDIGGESSRPGSNPVSIEEECSRVLPVLKRIRQRIKIPISIDTTKAEVARRAIDNGADLINDISALRFDKQMCEVISKAKIPVIIMHMRGTPENMQQNTEYDDLYENVVAFLQTQIDYAEKNGINGDKIIIDPGIGFGKSTEGNLSLLAKLDSLASLGKPIAVGCSRKSFIGNLLGCSPDERLIGSLAALAQSAFKGADIVRVHDVEQCVKFLTVFEAIGKESFHS
jgi:dihydropteroate synthase